jgi:psiF repeat
MRRTTWVVAVGAALAVLGGPAVWAQAGDAAAAAKPANSQQEKMKSCNAEATSKGLHGAGRKSFVSTCLSGEAAAKPANSQQEKMRSCSAEATTKGLKGADRKTFMSTCLKGPGSAASK